MSATRTRVAVGRSVDIRDYGPSVPHHSYEGSATAVINREGVSGIAPLSNG